MIVTKAIVVALAIGLASVLTASSAAAQTCQTVPGVCGNVDRDCDVTVLDALRVLLFAVGRDIPMSCECFALHAGTTTLRQPCGDVNQDGRVTVVDALRILYEAVGSILLYDNAAQLPIGHSWVDCSCPTTSSTTLP